MLHCFEALNQSLVLSPRRYLRGGWLAAQYSTNPSLKAEEKPGFKTPSPENFG
jgi:hypothetical protein